MMFTDTASQLVQFVIVNFIKAFAAAARGNC